MTKDELVQSLRGAWSRSERPEAPGANLKGANLRDANLRGANLRDANLRDANLWDADLRGARAWGGLCVEGLPSGQASMVPTCEGWQLQVGCWTGTREELRSLVAQDDGWPEAYGAEIAHRRPGLLAMLTLADAHAEYHADRLAAVVAKWGEGNE